MLSIRLFLTCLFFPLAFSYSNFDPNCTYPPEGTNIVGSSSIRGTFDILWACLSVLITCTWAIQHLAVPPYEPLENPSWKNAFKEKGWHSWKKLKWTILTIIGPEYIFAKALAELLAAKYSLKEFQKEYGKKQKKWSTTHAYFANMRGFILSFDIAAVPTSDIPSKPSRLGNLRQRPRARHPISYHEQDVEGAILIELEQCREICGEPCPNQEGITPTIGSSPSPLASPSLPFLFNRPTIKPPRRRPPWWHGPSWLQRPSWWNWQKVLALVHLKGNETRATEPNPKSKLKRKRSEPPIHLENLARRFETGLTLPPLPRNIASHSLSHALGRHRLHHAEWALSASQILYACQAGILPGPPSVTAEELSDRSKGDAFVKVAAIVQITWLVMQIIARSIEGLATSLLEVTVLAFAATAIATNLVLLPKPQDVRMPIILHATGVLSREHIIALAARSPPSSMAVHEFWLHGVAIRDQADNVFPYSPGLPLTFPSLRSLLSLFTNNADSDEDDDNAAALASDSARPKPPTKEPAYINTVIAGIGIAGTIFGSVHCAAWSFNFPTPLEQTLWRVSCLVILIFPLMGALAYATVRHEAKEGSHTDNKTNAWLRPMGYAAVPIYILARIYLSVEPIRSLAYLPSSAYVSVGWPNWLPHVL